MVERALIRTSSLHGKVVLVMVSDMRFWCLCTVKGEGDKHVLKFPIDTVPVVESEVNQVFRAKRRKFKAIYSMYAKLLYK